MTEKEKIEFVLKRNDVNDLEDLIFTYLHDFQEDFSTLRLHNLITTLQVMNLSEKISRQCSAIDISHERASYLKIFLEGKMYTTEEAARKHVPIHIENAKTIIEKCKEAK